jgi:hypothetical protein
MSQRGHARWVRVSHWVITVSLLMLVFSGIEILMVHPRLYWGEAGNDLTPALLELPISRNYQHQGYQKPVAFFTDAAGPVSAVRTYDIFNQNGWGRSLHFLGAWVLVIPGLIYLLAGIVGGHFRSHILPGGPGLTPGGPNYNALQKATYSFVIFVASPLIVLTGLTMSPAVTAAFPFLLNLFGGQQSARTIHFFTFAVLVLFVFGHVVMVIKSGFMRQMRSMTIGERS